VVGGVATFFAINALDELLKVAIGTAIGWLIGLAIYVQLDQKHQEQRSVDLHQRPRVELLEEARRLNIENATLMSSEELADAIAGGVQPAHPDRAAEAMRDTLDGAKNLWNRRKRSGR
jgi:hypothetical protein